MQSNDTNAHKAALRKDILAKRRALAPEVLQAHAAAVAGYVLGMPQWKDGRKILRYMPLRQELDTMAIVAEAWACGKEVYLPRCDAMKKGIMQVALCRAMDELVEGAYGILEPDPARCPACELDGVLIDLALIPAVAFDTQGNRLGYGGGYYDRFLAHAGLHKTCLVGLAHALQVVDALPREPWDCAMHAVCTERGMLWV